MGCISPDFGLFSRLRAHFLYVEGNGEEGKVHCDLVFSEVPEAAVRHVEFHLAEDGLGFYASSPAMPDPILRGEQLPCFASVFVQPVVHFNYSLVVFGFIAKTTQRATLAVLSAVAGIFTPVATGRL